MAELADGSVIPSHFSIEGSSFDDGGQQSNTLLRQGEVTEVRYPKDPLNRSKTSVEYRVRVQHRGPGGVYITRNYDNCVMWNPMAGLADRMVWRLRAEDKGVQRDSKKLFGRGSKVLILCVNGEQNNAIILGGLRDQQDVVDIDEGQVLHFRFNGITFDINDEGEMTCVYGGKSDIAGKKMDSVDDAVVGTGVQFLKNGSLRLFTKSESILIDHANKKVIIKEDSGVEVGAATDAWMLGTTYRKAQTQCNTDLQTGLAQLAVEMGVVGAALSTSASMLSIPVVGGMLAAPTVLVASQGMIQAVQTITKMQAAIAKFEAGDATYLSKHNLTD